MPTAAVLHHSESRTSTTAILAHRRKYPMIPNTLIVAMVAGLCCAVGVAEAQQTRPATAAERSAMGFDDPDAVVMIRQHGVSSNEQRDRSLTGILTGNQYQTRIGLAFKGRTSGFEFMGNPPPSMACQAGSPEVFADATLDLPDGASIEFIDVFGLDSSTTDDLTMFLFSVCQSTFDGNPQTPTNLGSISTSGNPGNTAVTLVVNPNVVVDRYSCRYFLRARMATSGAGPCVGASLYLDKARIQYEMP